MKWAYAVGGLVVGLILGAVLLFWYLSGLFVNI
jgi:uncharacterized membrane-anchored protein YhcB (DUF1043 family)